MALQMGAGKTKKPENLSWEEENPVGAVLEGSMTNPLQVTFLTTSRSVNSFDDFIPSKNFIVWRFSI
jgi:hypothetical protein